MPYPTEVRRMPAEKVLRLTWNDGHVADYEYTFLRGYCPCAGCQGHASGDVNFHPPPGPVEPNGIEPVGNYALSFAWSDGHATGIYRYEFLREICPCEPCQGDRRQSSAGEGSS